MLSRPIVPQLLPVLMAALFLIPTAGGRAMLETDEATFSGIARNMLESGDWVTPYINGVRHFDKPPFLFWVMAASFSLFGVSEFAARLPNALLLLGITVLVTRMASRAAGPAAGLYSGLAFSCCIGAYLFTREALHDPGLIFFLTLAFWAFLLWYGDPRKPRVPALIFYACLGAGTLTKGLIAILFPVAIVALFFAVSRQAPRLRDLHLAAGLVVLLAIAAPWHWLVATRNPGFAEHYFLNEHVRRFLNTRPQQDFASVPLSVFLGLLPAWLFPWTAFVPAAFAGEKLQSERALIRLALLWAGFVLLFFSISSGRLEHYLFPALPAIAILIGCGLHRNRDAAVVRYGYAALAILGLLLALLGLAGAALYREEIIGALAGDPGGRHVQSVFSPVLALPPDALERLMAPAAATIAGFALSLTAAWWLRRSVWAAIALAAGVGIFGIAAHVSLGICEDLVSSRSFAREVARHATPDTRLLVRGSFESANSMLFYQPLPLEVLGKAPTLDLGLTYPGAPRRKVSIEEAIAAWNSDQAVILLTPRELQSEFGSGKVLLERAGRVLLRNR
ncbi:MAG: glycosyltransferase family 39 protein [Bryobacteraceae bacterium]|nr:glycosyltransferase family 39 protein [Bryobacteraceae bacterium]